jgi:hypothetical protein
MQACATVRGSLFLRNTASNDVFRSPVPKLYRYTNSVRTSQETHYVSATEPNRLMLFRETVAVYFENHTDHTYTNSVRTSQETHYVSATKPNQLMLFRETVAVYCENHKEHRNTLCGQHVYVRLSRRYRH